MLAVIAALALLPAVLLPADEYEFVPDPRRWVQVNRNEGNQHYLSRGRLDAAGNLVPDKYWLNWDQSLPISGLHAIHLNEITYQAVYEYRSGVLVKGRIDDRSCNFVPDLGSKVVTFQDYLRGYRAGVDPRIWNLPGTIERKGAPGADANEVRDSQVRPPLGAGPRIVSPVSASDYIFVQDRDRRVEVQRRDGDQLYWSIGTLDPAGNFIPDKDYLNRTDPSPADAPAAVLLNRDGLGPVYEYRSGRLVRGRVDPWTHNFVPEVGSTVLDFRDYRYGAKDSRYGIEPLPIWNLPGTFQKKDADKK
jgi:hypothetical protein